VASYSCLVAERGDHGGEHGQESEEGKEGKEGKENSQEEKEVTRSMKISCAGQRLRSVTPSFRSQKSKAPDCSRGPVYTENPIRIDDVMESPKLAE